MILIILWEIFIVTTAPFLTIQTFPVVHLYILLSKYKGINDIWSVTSQYISMCAMAFEYAARFLKQGSLNISKYENQIFKNNNVGYEILCTILLKYAKT